MAVYRLRKGGCVGLVVTYGVTDGLACGSWPILPGECRLGNALNGLELKAGTHTVFYHQYGCSSIRQLKYHSSA